MKELIVDEKDPTNWTVIFRSKHELFKDCDLYVSINFGTNYPTDQPSITFETKIFHPNVDSSTGKVTFGPLRKENWMPTVTIRDLLFGLDELLVTPELDTPVNKDPAGYRNMVKEKVAKFTTPFNESAPKK